MSVNMGSAVGYLELDTSKFQSGFKSALNDVNDFGKSADTLSSKLTSAGKAFETTGSTLTKSFTVPIVGLATAAVKTASDFETAMAEVQAISGATGEDFTKLENLALEMGRTTIFSASEAAEGLKYMAMAGWETNDMLDALEGVMLLAAASGENLGTVSDIVTDAMTAFGLEASEAAHFADVLAQASNSSNTNVALLGESFKYVAPVAGALGFSIEDTAVALGLMANQGIKAGSAGTQLRRILANMIDPTDKQAAAMEDLNLEITNADGTMKSLDEIMVDLRAGFEGLTEEEQAFYAATIGGTQGMAGLLAIVNTSDEDFNRLTESIAGSDGAAQEMADIMAETLGVQLKLLQSAIEAVAIEFGNILIPVISKVVDFLTNLADKIATLSDEEKEQIVRIAAIVAAIGPMLTIIGKVLTTMGQLTSGIGAIKGLGAAKGISGIVGALGTVAAPLAAIVAGIVAFKVAWDNNIGGLRDKVQEGIDYFVETVGPAFESIKESIIRIVGQIKEAWDNDFGGIKTIVENVVSAIGTILENFIKTIADIIALIAALLEGDFEAAWDIVKGIFERAIDGIKSILENLWNIIKQVASNLLTPLIDAVTTAWEWVVEKFTAIKDWIVKTITELPGNIANAISNFIDTIVNWVSDTYDKAVEGIQNMYNAVVEFFDDLPYKIGYALGNAIGEVINWIEEQWNAVQEAIPKLIEAISTWFSELPGRLKAWFDETIQRLGEWLTETYENTKQGINDWLESVSTWFSELPGRVKQWLDDTIQRIAEWISSTGEQAKEAGSQFLETVVEWIKQLPDKFKEWFDAVIEFLKGLPSQLMDLGKNIMNGFFDGIKSIGEGIVGWFQGIADTIGGFLRGIWDGITGARNAQEDVRSMGSHAAGLDYVPFDGYTATLHEGERVLTAQENRSYNDSGTGGGSSGGGDTFIFNSPIALTPAEAARKLKQAKLETSLNFS